MLWSIVVGVILFINLLCLIFMIFLERRNAQSVLSWALVMNLLPLLGFLLYCLIGNSLSIKTRKMMKRKSLNNLEFRKMVIQQRLEIDNGEMPLREEEEKYKQLIRQNLLMSRCVLTQNNKIEIFTSGEEKMEALLSDLRNAKKSINMLYYIFATDKIGKQVLEVLIERARAGVEVNLMVDAVGSLHSNMKEFKKLVDAGGRFCEFFPPLFGFKLFNIRVNYRNHRKIVVIDNQIAYTGGINIRDDHMGGGRLCPWIDMHIKIQGDAVVELQKLFLGDWRFSYRKKDFDETNLSRFFEPALETGESGVQVVHSGPNEDEEQHIKKTMIKMMLSAKKSIVIETPYFVPDDTFLEAMKIAIASGVDVKIITPAMPDKMYVFYTSLSYLREIVFSGATVYQRNGFIHSKCMVVDDEICLVGTCNTDIRSFKLNFEDSCIIYDEKVAKRVSDICSSDIANSREIDKKWFNSLPLSVKGYKSFFRLFSALL